MQLRMGGRAVEGSGARPVIPTLPEKMDNRKSSMHRRIAWLIALLLIGTGATTATRASQVTTYGAGLKSCGSYLQARDQESADEMAFVDWFSGYLSGVNATYNRSNNVLANSNLKEAVYWLEKYCRAHTGDSFATASFALLRSASSTTRTQAAEPITYGAGFKSCGTYLSARDQRDSDEMAFVDWLGGYLSGVNAISLGNTNILGTSDITGAITWLDSYCREHASARFAAAVMARVTVDTPPSKH